MNDDDNLLFEIKETVKKSRTTFESVINRKNMPMDDLDEMMNHIY